MRSSIPLVFVGLAGAALAACGESAEAPCSGANGACIEIPEGDDEYRRLQDALIRARPGDVIHLGEGVFEMRLDLSLYVDGVTIRGEGMDKTVLTFANQIEGAQGLLIESNDVTLEDFAVEDPMGDAIKFEGSTNVTVRRVRTEWTGGPNPNNGAYGIYPVRCTNVLVEHSVARGASDTGIYVGQSNHIIVRHNYTYENVAGIEMENSQDADVYGNETTGNTAGILVFNLPGLPVKDGRRIRVFDNDIHDNNEPNFAPQGNIVGYVPQGTGFATISAREVEFFDNRVSNNQTANFAVVSYLLVDLPWDDDEFDPYPETVYAHDNVFIGGGHEPSEELGFLLVQALVGTLGAPVIVPDLIIDGYVNPMHVGPDGQLLPQYRFCAQRNGDANFANLDAPNNYASVSLDLSKHDCEHPALPEVTLP